MQTLHILQDAELLLGHSTALLTLQGVVEGSKPRDLHLLRVEQHLQQTATELNKLAGGSPTSNHLTGCAVDIHVEGFEQAVRYASILLDISEGTKRDFDELYIERNKAGSYWIHFAVRPRDNRRKGGFILAK